VLIVVTGDAAAAGTIRGRVELPAVPPIERRPSLTVGMGAGEPAPSDQRRVSVVYLERAPRGAFEGRDDRHYRMDQRREQFVPRVLAIPVGATVDFPNSDPVFHNVFSLSRPRSFDLGRYAAGRSRAVRFDRPGIIRVFCDIHSHMSAFILVFAHRFFAVTSADGTYRIDGVPPGTYALSVWHEALPGVTRQVTVPENGDVEADFVLARARTAP
jgi:plastocyanin